MCSLGKLFPRTCDCNTKMTVFTLTKAEQQFLVSMSATSGMATGTRQKSSQLRRCSEPPNPAPQHTVEFQQERRDPSVVPS